MNKRQVAIVVAGLGWLLVAGGFGTARAGLHVEAENVVANPDAWVRDGVSPDKWVLWSKDKDAQKKWCGGLVLKSPVVSEDRTGPEAGAPPLHVRIKNVPEAAYDLSFKMGRVLAVSFDGRDWKRCLGPAIGFDLRPVEGVIEFWVDDRYAVEKNGDRGASYLDCLFLQSTRPAADGVSNGGFEERDEAGGPKDWKVDGVKAQMSEEEKHSGKRALRVSAKGDAAWRIVSDVRLRVAPGAEFRLGAKLRGLGGETEVRMEAIGYGEDATSGRRLGGGRLSPGTTWKDLIGFCVVPEGINRVEVAFGGKGPADFLLDDAMVRPIEAVIAPRPAVKGWANERVEEKMGRGVVALPADKGVYVGWRLLRGEDSETGFDVFRKAAGGEEVRLNDAPVTATTDFFDAGATDLKADYRIGLSGGRPGESGIAAVGQTEGGFAFTRIKLDGAAATVQKVGIGDLDGDGVYDYVLKGPNANIDPYSSYWKKSEECYWLEARRSDGRLLWRKDLGWGIERGIWYSPFIVWDLNGDGKAEVAAKTSEGDPRDPDGRVTGGPEFVTVWDGLTGRELARANWISRDIFESYNLASRNQMAVAYLDGRTPSLLVLRGTYGRMAVRAYELRDGKLGQLWEYDNVDYGPRYWGQGAHFTLAADLDGDKRDEVLLGSVALDDTGAPLWATGKGHPDAHYLGDLNPARPGWEVGYVMETRQTEGGGLCQADARTGKLLWELKEPTQHVHSKGFCADVDPTEPGMEIYGADSEAHKMTGRCWLFAADGRLLGSGKELNLSFGRRTVYWDADLQKEFVEGRVSDYGGLAMSPPVSGSVILQADVLGDWREEIFVTMPGELRICSTTIPAMDRRVCLMQDPVYRFGTAMNAMGYTQDATLSVLLETEAPNVNVTWKKWRKGEGTCRVAASAPGKNGWQGTCRVMAGKGVQLDPAEWEVALDRTERCAREVAVRGAGAKEGMLRVELKSEGETRRIAVPWPAEER